MKKWIIASLAFIACNAAGRKTGEAENVSAPAAQPGKEVQASGPCNSLVFFKKGAVIEAKSYDGAGNETASQETKILDVKEEGSMTVAYMEGKDTDKSDGKTTAVNYSYKCDGEKIYFDVASLFRTAAKNGDASFESSLIEYPLHFEEGQVLPDATGTMSSEKNGRKSTIRYYYKDRKVEGKEKVTTPAGSWDCFKVTNTVEAEMDIAGMSERARKMMEAMKGQAKMSTATWFAPGFGIVKMEAYRNGKLESKNVVTAVR